MAQLAKVLSDTLCWNMTSFIMTSYSCLFLSHQVFSVSGSEMKTNHASGLQVVIDIDLCGVDSPVSHWEIKPECVALSSGFDETGKSHPLIITIGHTRTSVSWGCISAYTVTWCKRAKSGLMVTLQFCTQPTSLSLSLCLWATVSARCQVML